MNLQCWFPNVADAKKSAAVAGFFRQILRHGLCSASRFMSSFARVRNVAVSAVWTLAFLLVFPAAAQTNYYAPNGTEYAVVGSLLGDQIFSDAAISPTNGVVVWQDNATDGDGWGISAQRLDATLSGTRSPFRVNVIGAGDQENPRVALLKNGGAAFVWQGGAPGGQHIYARFLGSGNTFLSTTDILVSTFTGDFQANPALAVLTNGNVAVVWSSYNQAGSNSMLDVYGQILSTNGAAVGANFLVNQFTNFNQRTPAVAALHNGGFVVTWVSEQERSTAPNWGSNTVYYSSSSVPLPTVDIYARLFNAAGAPTANEFLVNTDVNPCANPAAAAAPDGSFMLVWGEKNLANITNDWDIYARPFSSAAVGGNVFVVNNYTYGDQFGPCIKGIGSDYLVAWTSLGQDGSREGVFGQFVHNTGVPVGGEFLVNTTTIGQQMHPAVASDGVSQFLAVWTSFTGSPYGFDLFAHRYINVSSVLLAMSAPYVWAPFVTEMVGNNSVYQPELVVSWPPLLGLSVTNYEVYADGAGAPTAVVTSNSWTMTAANGLTASSTHSFAVDYVTTGGQRSPISPSASGTTWSGAQDNGIPAEWMEQYYGLNFGAWPANVNAPLVPGGPSLYQVFLSGGNPTNSATWLGEQLANTAEGPFLTWNTQAGATYQVQSTTDFKQWTNLGSPRFAAGASDSIFLGRGAAVYYRVVLLRQ